MKKTTLITLLFSISIFNATAQEQKETKGFLKFGSGVYLDVSSAFYDYKDPFSGISHDKTILGQTLWVEGGYKLPNNILLSINIMNAIFKDKYIDIVFQGKKNIQTQQNYGVNFGYEFNLNNKNKIVPSFGLLYNRLLYSNVTYEFYQNNEQVYIANPHIVEGVDEQLGLNFNLDYHHQFKNNFFLGARVNAVYLLSIGLENFIFSPVLGVKF